MSNKKKLCLPWLIFNIYMIIVLIISLFGPWEYEKFDLKSKILVSIYLLLFLLISSIMYYCGIRTKHRVIYSPLNTNKNVMLFLKVNIMLAFFILIWLCISEIKKIELSYFSITNISDSISLAYKNSHSNIKTRMRTMANTCYILGYGTIQFAIVVGINKFKELNWRWKTITISIIALLGFYNLFIVGSNRGILEIFILIFAAYIAKYIVLLKHLKRGTIISIFIVVSVFFAILSSLLFNRISLWGSIETSFYTKISWVNLDNWMVRYFPPEIAYTICMGFSYLSQGIYGLSQCLELPYVFSYGLGSSPAIRGLLAKFGFTIDRITYPERLELISGWKARANWHTIFPWIASDVTFWGALIIMGIWAYIFAIVWKDIVKNNDIFSIALLPNFLIMWGFVPANNQIFISTTSTFAFIYLMILWTLFRGKNHKYA